ncbi:hypothetical protein BCR44DRAFT_48456 [Catenaria anguillulae PL171]|uniref:Uncharacterized protein n=1 Tax=Catenaria anguillulae PL171 TaxID=765915 RepID=A0A1Y2HCD3_9FUNG|nr:hypothetical protein BCR44DRAFT_48456 [Catenaria anguillulae PL171]
MTHFNLVSFLLLSAILFLYFVCAQVPLVSLRFLIMFPTAIFMFSASFAFFLRVLGNGNGTGTPLSTLPRTTPAAVNNIHHTQPDLVLFKCTPPALHALSLAEKYTQQVLAQAATKLRLCLLEADLAARAATESSLRAEIDQLKSAAAHHHIEFGGVVDKLALAKAECAAASAKIHALETANKAHEHAISELTAAVHAKESQVNATLDRAQRRWDRYAAKVACKAKEYERKKRDQVKLAVAREQAVRAEFDDFKCKSYTYIGWVSWIEERLLAQAADVVALKKELLGREAVVRDLRWAMIKANDDKDKMRAEWEAAKVLELVAQEYTTPVNASVVDELCAGIAGMSIECDGSLCAEGVKQDKTGDSGVDAAVTLPQSADSACSLLLPSPSSPSSSS